MKRWLMLEEHAALLMPDWLPPAEDWPELAEYRAEHERLLALRQKAWDEACALIERFKAEDDARAQAVGVALVEEREPDEPETTPPAQREDERREAVLKWEKTTDLLVEFLERVCGDIKERASELYAALEAENGDAEAMREQARRLLSEADLKVGEVTRKRFWLDRGTGRSVLGYYPFEQMAVPLPPEQPDWAEVLASGSTVEGVYA